MSEKNIHIPVLGAIAQTRQGVPYRLLGLGLGFRQCTEQQTRAYILALLHHIEFDIYVRKSKQE